MSKDGFRKNSYSLLRASSRLYAHYSGLSMRSLVIGKLRCFFHFCTESDRSPPARWIICAVNRSRRSEARKGGVPPGVKQACPPRSNGYDFLGFSTQTTTVASRKLEDTNALWSR